MAPGPVEGDSDSSLSPVPSDFDNTPRLSPPSQKMPDQNQASNGSKPHNAASSPNDDNDNDSIVVSDTIIARTKSGDDNNNGPSSPPVSTPGVIGGRVTRSATKPRTRIRIIKSNENITDENIAQPDFNQQMPRGKINKWTEENIMTGNKRSPLSGEEVREILTTTEAADALSPAARAKVLSLLPPDLTAKDANGQMKPSTFKLRNTDDFRADAVRFGEDLTNGNHSKKFIEEAATARWQRSTGQMDAEAVKQFQHEWGVELPDELLPPGLKAGELRNAKKPIDFKKAGDAEERKEMFMEAKAEIRGREKIAEEKMATEESKTMMDVDVAPENRPVPMVRYAPPRRGGKKHKIMVPWATTDDAAKKTDDADKE